MAFVEIPKHFKYICDICREVHIQTGGLVPYGEKRPVGWSHIRFDRDMPTTRVDWLLCVQCTGAAIPALEQFKEVNRVHNNAS